MRRILTEVGDAEHAEYRVHSGRLRGSGHMGSRVGLEAVLHSVETNVHRIYDLEQAISLGPFPPLQSGDSNSICLKDRSED